MNLFKLLTLILSTVYLVGCNFDSPEKPTSDLDSEQLERGRKLVMGYGCVKCHNIPHTTLSDSWIGPPLKHWKNRKVLVGKLPNTKKNLIQWLIDPNQFSLGTAMPNLSVSRKDAEDMAEFLFSLE